LKEVERQVAEDLRKREKDVRSMQMRLNSNPSSEQVAQFLTLPSSASTMVVISIVFAGEMLEEDHK
jgi:DNA-directed RNA polymerase specialized sigma subunit